MRHETPKQYHERLKAIRTMAWAETGGHCVYCGADTPMHLRTLDHVIPKSRRGGLNLTNAVPACDPCNQWRADKRPASKFAHWKWIDYVIRKEKALRTVTL